MADAIPWLTTVLWPSSRVLEHGEPSEGSGLSLAALPSPTRPNKLMSPSLAGVRVLSSRFSDDRSTARTVLDGIAAGVLAASSLVARSRRLRLSLGGEDSLVDEIRESIDPTITGAVVLCGPPRANQKPVLLLHDWRGRLGCVVKVSWNDLTHDLLGREAATLLHLERYERKGFVAPVVLGQGSCGTGQWLAMTPVVAARRAKATVQSVIDLARAIEQTGEASSHRVVASDFALRLAAAGQALPLTRRAVSVATSEDDDAPSDFGAGHGDFVPWNRLSGSPRPAVWDWERYEPCVPVGYDRFHDALQVALHRLSLSPAASVAAVLQWSPSLVPELSPSRARSNALWYFASIIHRYERDAGASGNDVIRRLAVDLCQAVESSRRAG